MKINLRKGIPLLCLSATLMLGMNQASAFTSMGNKIVTECDILGFPLLTEYANDTCDAACHRNNQGQSAYSSGNWEYFCPEPIVQGPTCTDADNDGYFAEGIDCGTLADFNDNNANAYPGAAEDCTDGIDNDGNGLADAADPNAVGCPVNCIDQDGDGYNVDGGSCGPVDCDDGDIAINPGAEENCSDTIDNNCNGLIDTADMNAVACPITCTDQDGDGYSIEGGACGAMDCDDANESVNPGALEICDDGIDNNCNSRSDASDSVCQTTDEGDDEQDETPWWRKRSRDRDDNYPRWNRRSHDRDDDDDDDENRSRSNDDDSSSRTRSYRTWRSSWRNSDRDDD